jgi:hypothetical protein
MTEVRVVQYYVPFSDGTEVLTRYVIQTREDQGPWTDIPLVHEEDTTPETIRILREKNKGHTFLSWLFKGGVKL